MLPSSVKRVSSCSGKRVVEHTINLDLEPAEGGSRELLFGGSVMESVRDLDV